MATGAQGFACGVRVNPYRKSTYVHLLGTYISETEETVPSAEELFSENFSGVGPQRNRPEPVEQR